MKHEEEKNTNVGDFSFNLEGYPNSKGKSEKEDEEENSEENTKTDNVGDEGNQRDHSKEARDDKEDTKKAKEDPVNMREEEQIEKVVSLAREEVDKNESPQRDTMLSFLHTAKLKADSMLQVDSWMYNELMSLKRKMENLQKNQDSNQVKINQMDVQVGNIPDKLKDYEQNLWLLIKESGDKMEQVTSNICAATTSLGKFTNE